MKKTYSHGLCVLVVSCIVLLLCGCSRSKELRYYSDKENYITITGTVRKVTFDKMDENVIFCLENVDVQLPEYNFWLVGESFREAEENGIAERLLAGADVCVTVAPAYWGDGFIYPVAAMEIDGISVLKFDDGYENLIEAYRSDAAYKKYFFSIL